VKQYESSSKAIALYDFYALPDTLNTAETVQRGQDIKGNVWCSTFVNFYSTSHELCEIFVKYFELSANLFSGQNRA